MNAKRIETASGRPRRQGMWTGVVVLLVGMGLGANPAPETASMPATAPSLPDPARAMRGPEDLDAPAGAVRFRVGSGGDWHAPNHWASASAGPGGASVPGAADMVVFDTGSGSGEITMRENVRVTDLLVTDAADAGLMFAQHGGVELRCDRDAIFRRGGLAPRGNFHLSVGRNLDTSGLIMPAKARIHVALTGTGYWRYSLKKPHKPTLRTLLAAQKGQTTTLRPVEIAPVGVDIDVSNCVLGDRTSLLTMDLSEVKHKRPRVTLEIHQQKDDHLDIEAGGCRVAIHSIEHETGRVKRVRLQHNLSFDLKNGVYDVTGAFHRWEDYRENPRAAFDGPTWIITGPMDIGSALLSIEKSSIFDTGGHDFSAGRVSIGNGSGCGQMRIHKGRLTVKGRVTVGSSTFPGRLDLGSGRLTCAELLVRRGSIVTGRKGAVLDITGRFTVEEGAELDIEGVVLKSHRPAPASK
jgi:hypothetical protein